MPNEEKELNGREKNGMKSKTPRLFSSMENTFSNLKSKLSYASSFSSNVSFYPMYYIIFYSIIMTSTYLVRSTYRQVRHML